MERDRLTATSAKLERLASRAGEKAQSSNDSAAPELLDGLERLLRRHDHWQAAAKGSGPSERRRLMREAEQLMFDLRKLPLSLEGMPLEKAR